VVLTSASLSTTLVEEHFPLDPHEGQAMEPVRTRWAISTRRLMILIAAVALFVGFAKPVYERQEVIGTAAAFLEKDHPGSTGGDGPESTRWIEDENAWEVEYHNKVSSRCEHIYVRNGQVYYTWTGK
jgi:hypothetical protein